MRIKFEITDIPIAEQKNYPTAYLEGILKIYVKEVVFFNQSGILLIEFAIFISRWLNNVKTTEFVDFSFETMDNDESILSLNYVNKNLFRIYSIWQELEVKELLTKEEIVAEFEKYLESLENELKLKTEIDLSSVLKDIQW
ncbi:hypothetical protein [Emticicia sp. 21SJ11W-3]|uniref:DUF7878 domain-containing protein n=1 Tax=Emticicia sp. 21SJ11W-3 TaxID=2916755 RepID=UPI00209E3373|nr:hypothetical protein [Emticicia sp. 21SJ11W-3]UTA67287.1 hypothetical protein MB380_16990 [Emticicia sp. 21SJ11W-3]